MRPLFSLFCALPILTLAWRWSCSGGVFLVTGLGPALLLDRYLFRALPWFGPSNGRWELAVRSVPLLVGTSSAYLARYPIVSPTEALRWGAMLGLGTFLLEALIELGPWRRWALGLRLGAGALVALAVPYLVAIHPLHTVPKRSPATLGLPFEDVRFRTADGLRLAGWLVPHPQPRGNVLFCHGHGRNRGHAAALLTTLHGLRLNVLAFDFRGHGDSAGHTCTFGDREVGDVVAAAAYLRRRCPDQPLFVIGVSLGAAVALQALPQLPDVQGVWSEGCFARFSPVIEDRFTALPIPLRRPLLAAYDVLAALDVRFSPATVNPVCALSGSPVPICFCHGRCDELVPFAQAELLYEAHPGPKDRYWPEGGDHYNLRRRREEYLGRLRGFLERRLNSARQSPNFPPAPPSLG
jgi:fermentation-respiration switch protein FrsA (DUF1100 family)